MKTTIAFLGKVLKVQGRSMEPTLTAGDVVWVLPCKSKQVKVGDIVLVFNQTYWIIKRVRAFDPDNQEFLLGVEFPFGKVPSDWIKGKVLGGFRLGKGFFGRRSLQLESPTLNPED